MHEANEMRKTLTDVQGLNQDLMSRVANLTDREKMLKTHLDDMRDQLHASQKQLENLTKDTMRFHAHHDKVIEDYKEQDEKHFKAMAVSQGQERPLL